MLRGSNRMGVGTANELWNRSQETSSEPTVVSVIEMSSVGPNKSSTGGKVVENPLLAGSSGARRSLQKRKAQQQQQAPKQKRTLSFGDAFEDEPIEAGIDGVISVEVRDTDDGGGSGDEGGGEGGGGGQARAVQPGGSSAHPQHDTI